MSVSGAPVSDLPLSSLSMPTRMVGEAAGTSTVTATGVARFSGVGSAGGTSTVTATGVARFSGVGTAGGTSTVTAVGRAQFAATGSAAGTGTATARGAASAVGTAPGVGAATATGASRFSAAGTAAGTGAALGDGVASVFSDGAAAGTGAASGVGRAQFISVGSAAGVGAASGVGRQTLRAAPTGDVSIGDWTDQADGTTNLYAVLDEIDTANDADYVKSPQLTAGQSDTLELSLPALGDAGVSIGHSVTYRYKKSGDGDIDLTVSLVQGVTVIASWTHTSVGTTFITATQVLSGPEADAITDYADLRLRFAAAA